MKKLAATGVLIAVLSGSLLLAGLGGRSADALDWDRWGPSGAVGAVVAQQPTLDVPHATIPPTLDGELSEWAGVPEAVLSRFSAVWSDYRGQDPPELDDASMTFQAMWDDNTLYFGLQVRDDVLVRDSETIWWDDEIEIWVDGDADGDTGSLFDHQYTFNTDGTVTDGTAATDIAVQIRQVTGGWIVEVAVPADHLPAGALAGGSSLPLTFGYRDDDDGDSWDQRLLWAGDDDNNNRADHYGSLLLGPAGPTATPTATASATESPTATTTASTTPTATSTPSPTATPSSTASATPTPSPSPTATVSGEPDLSASSKSAMPETVDYFEEVTYTIVLRNDGEAPAEVSLVDAPPLPYRTGSALGGIRWDDLRGEIWWNGILGSGESRVFMFKVHGLEPIVPHNTVYINEAIIDDGVHPPFVRSATILLAPEPTSTATLAPSPTMTSTATPTRRPIVTDAPTLTPTPTQTPTPTLTPTPVVYRFWLPLMLAQ